METENDTEQPQAGGRCAPADGSPLTASRVEEIFMECLFREGEPTETHVVGEGVIMKAGFHPDRLASHKSEILSMLHQLSDDFREDKGGGMSFLNACVTRDGDQWGEHLNIDQLLALGVATGQARVLTPREIWSMLPGGLPYFSVSACEADAALYGEGNKSEREKRAGYRAADYTGEPCKNCGRNRVMNCANEKHVCEKCGWDADQNEYSDYLTS